MADRGNGLACVSKAFDQRYGVLVGAQQVGVDLTAGQDNRVVVINGDIRQGFVGSNCVAPVVFVLFSGRRIGGPNDHWGSLDMTEVCVEGGLEAIAVQRLLYGCMRINMFRIQSVRTILDDYGTGIRIQFPAGYETSIQRLKKTHIEAAGGSM